MNNNTMNTVASCLVYNNRFASEKLTADQLGAKEHKEWLDAIKSLHKSAYEVAVFCENNHAKTEDVSVDKSSLYASLRTVLNTIGEVNGHKLFANDALATLIVGYSNRRANSDSPALQLVNSQIANNKRTLAIYENSNGVSEASIKYIKDELETLAARKEELLSREDNRIKVVTRTSINGFRLDVEHLLARAISEQSAKTWEQLEAEAEERRAARRAKTKEKKQKNKVSVTTSPIADVATTAVA